MSLWRNQVGNRKLLALHKFPTPKLDYTEEEPESADREAAVDSARVQVNQLQRAIHNPRSASPQVLRELNSRYGNQAVQRLLKNNAHPTVVQRFPADVFDKPYKGWRKNKFQVVHPDEGLNGGVHIANDHRKNQPVKKVVIKPLAGNDSPNQSHMGDAIMQEFEVNVPGSRIVANDSKEYSQLVKMLGPGLSQETLARLEGFKLMVGLAGGTLAGNLKAAKNDEQKHAEVMGTLTNPAVLDQLGRMIVADALMGNDDRISMGFSPGGGVFNLGNIMIDNGRVYAIDSSAVLTSRVLLNAFIHKSIKDDNLISELITKLFVVIENFMERTLDDNHKAVIRQGIFMGVNNARALYTKAAESERVREAATKTYGTSDQSRTNFGTYQAKLRDLAPAWQNSNEEKPQRNNNQFTIGNRPGKPNNLRNSNSGQTGNNPDEQSSGDKIFTYQDVLDMVSAT